MDAPTTGPTAAERARRRDEAVAAGARAGFVGAMGAAGVLLVAHAMLREVSTTYRLASVYPKRIVGAVLVAGASGFAAQRTPGALAQRYSSEDAAARERADVVARAAPRVRA